MSINSQSPQKSTSPWLIWVPVIILALAFTGGSIVLSKYGFYLQAEKAKNGDRPPYITRLETDLTGLTE